MGVFKDLVRTADRLSRVLWLSLQVFSTSWINSGVKCVSSGYAAVSARLHGPKADVIHYGIQACCRWHAGRLM